MPNENIDIKKRGRPTSTANQTKEGRNEGLDTGATTADGEQQPEPITINILENSKNVLVDNKKQRGRPKGTAAKKEESAAHIDYSEISALLETAFTIVALRAGNEWLISTPEADSITKPLCRILEKFNLAEKVSEMSDGAALVLATTTVVVPRVMMSLAKKQDINQKVINEGNKGVTSNEKSRITEGNGNENNESSRKYTDGESIKALVNTLNQ